MYKIGDVLLWRDFEFRDSDRDDFRNKYLVIMALPDQSLGNNDYLFLLTTSKNHPQRTANAGTRCANGYLKGYLLERSDQPSPWFLQSTWIVFKKVWRVEAESLDIQAGRCVVSLEFRLQRSIYDAVRACFQFAQIDTAGDDFSRVSSSSY